MIANLQTQVAIVGAGPVGLTIAMDLANKGIDVVVLESRGEGEPADAKCNTVAARTMEVFRSLGVADAVRASGLRDDYPTDVIFCTAVAGHELTRIQMPSRNERMDADGRSAPGFPDSHWLTPEPVVRVSQLYLNPILYEHAKTFSRVTLMPATRFTGYSDHGDSVDVMATDASGEAIQIGCRYLIGCDGGNSMVRKQMGVDLEGDAEINRNRSSLVRCKAIRDLFPGKPAWMSWVVNPRTSGVVVAIDGEELWLIHRGLALSKKFDDMDRDQSIRDVLGVGHDFTWDVVTHQDWTARRLVAASFRAGNVFIEGDAAHIWIPYAGYGMNAGVADGTNLSWMLAAVLNQQADENLLLAHERERHPITEQVSVLAMNKALEYAAKSSGSAKPEEIEGDNEIARSTRIQLGKMLHEINLPQFACEGLNFGYFYDDSPAIHYDDEAAPVYDMGNATPSTVPGCRLPHFWVDHSTSVYDVLGPVYTLLQSNGASIDPSCVEAFAEVGLPLAVRDVAPQDRVFEHGFVLARADQHIAWRGNTCPSDLAGFINVLRGA